MENLESKISLIREDVSAFSQNAATLIVNDAPSQAQAIDFLSQIKVRIKRIEELRKEFVAPLNAQVTKINNMFKAQSEPLIAIGTQINTTLKTYMDEQARLAWMEAEKARKEKERLEQIEQEKIAKAEAEIKKLQRQAEAAKNDKQKKAFEAQMAAETEKQEQATLAIAEQQDVMIEAPKKSVRTEGGLATRKMVWKWKVTDLIKLRKAKPLLFILDEKAVNKMVSEGERDIPGIEIYQESQLAIKV